MENSPNGVHSFVNFEESMGWGGKAISLPDSYITEHINPKKLGS